MNDEQEEEQKKHLFYVLFNLILPTTNIDTHNKVSSSLD